MIYSRVGRILSRLVASNGAWALRIDERFEFFLANYTREDGSRWTMSEISAASKGRLKPNYLSVLRAGKVPSPGYEKLSAIAEVMGFPPALWHESEERLAGCGADSDVRARIEDLIENMPNDLGRPFTDEEISHRSGGALHKGEVAGIRSANIAPTTGQLLALAGVFSVDLAYFTQEKRPILSREAVEALAEEESAEIVHRTLALAAPDKRLVLEMLKHLEQRSGSDAASGT